MLSHVSLGTLNLARAEKFYTSVLRPLGYVKVWGTERGIGYGRQGGDDRLAIFEESDSKFPLAAGSGFHLAFEAPTSMSVDRFYAEAIANGGLGDGEPGSRHQYGPTYYAAFVIDPDGHRLEAVHQ